MFDLLVARFGYLMSEGLLEPTASNSLEALSDRLHPPGWKETEETALAAKSETYRELMKQADAAEAAYVPGILDGPVNSSARDPEYLAAAGVLHNKLVVLDTRLEKL